MVNGLIVEMTAQEETDRAAEQQAYIDEQAALPPPPVVPVILGTTIISLRETKSAPTIATGVLTLDCNIGNVCIVLLSEDITSIVFTNVPDDVYGITLTLVADGTARSVTWPASVKWPGGTAPTLTSTLNKEDTFVLITHDTGTTWAAAIAGQDR